MVKLSLSKIVLLSNSFQRSIDGVHWRLSVLDGKMHYLYQWWYLSVLQGNVYHKAVVQIKSSSKSAHTAAHFLKAYALTCFNSWVIKTKNWIKKQSKISHSTRLSCIFCDWQQLQHIELEIIYEDMHVSNILFITDIWIQQSNSMTLTCISY